MPIPGRDLADVVVEVDAKVTGVAVGAAVYAVLGDGRDGTEADYAIALPNEFAPKPRTLDGVQTA